MGSLQGSILNALQQGSLMGLSQDQAYRMALLQHIASLGQTSIAGVSGLGQSYMQKAGSGLGGMLQNLGGGMLSGGLGKLF